MAMEVQDEFDLLETLVLAYSFWDKFDHLKAASYFSQLHGKFDIRWQIDTSNSKEMIFKIAKQKEKFGHSREILDKFLEEILADLLANADRRAQEGKYDDAVARLYRAVEVISQMLLARRKIDTSRVKIIDLPSAWQEEYQESKELIKKKTALISWIRKRSNDSWGTMKKEWRNSLFTGNRTLKQAIASFSRSRRRESRRLFLTGENISHSW